MRKFISQVSYTEVSWPYIPDDKIKEYIRDYALEYGYYQDSTFGIQSVIGYYQESADSETDPEDKEWKQDKVNDLNEFLTKHGLDNTARIHFWW